MTNKHEREVSIEVTSRHQHVSDRTRDYATEKAQRLSKFNDRISRVQVLLEEEHGKFLAEVIVHVDRDGTLVSHGETDGFRASMDVSFDRLTRQLTKHKEKRCDHKHVISPAQLVPSDIDDEATFEDAVRDRLSE